MLSPVEIMNIVSLMLQMNQSQHKAISSLIQEIYESGLKEAGKVVPEPATSIREYDKLTGTYIVVEDT